MKGMKFSWQRLLAVMSKEFIQMRRDRLTFAMLIGVPLIQLILFGFAINSNPRHLPMGIISGDHSAYTRTLISAIQNTKYFEIKKAFLTSSQAKKMIAKGDLKFVLNIPTNFTRDLLNYRRPEVLVTADATDSMATANAFSVLRSLVTNVFDRDFARDGYARLVSRKPALQLVIHPKYNAEARSQYSIVPGLMGVVLTMTLVMITALAITRERERGTMESLLATPVRPLEVMLGKIFPYIIMGYLQQAFILIVALFLFHVPNNGSYWLLVCATLPFIVANLSVGLAFSTVAKNQLQAVQMTFFFFLPSILLSGFMFPFQGMPEWAQWIGNVLPLTHYVQITRGILLKGNGFTYIWPAIWPILCFMTAALIIALKQYRQTLD
jgi:ABC-2 type transport system permease protein